MANFMFVYRGGDDNHAKMTPGRDSGHHAEVDRLDRRGVAKGWMVDAGDALTPEGKWSSSKKVVTDGPFVESKEIVGGYSIVSADSIARRGRARQGLPRPPHRRHGRSADPRRTGYRRAEAMFDPSTAASHTAVNAP